MDNRGGGGKTPRGKKSRGRGRGQGQDSPSRTQPSSSSPSVSTTPVQQSPTVTSSLATPSSSTPLSRDGRTQAQVTKQGTPSTKSTVSTPTAEVPAPPKDTFEIKPKGVMETESIPVPPSPQEKPSDEVERSGPQRPDEEENEEQKKGQEEDVTVSSTIPDPEDQKKDEIQPKQQPESLVEENLQPPELPPPTLIETTETKVEEALAKPHHRPTAKTLVVMPPEGERATDAPLTVEIEPCETTNGGGEPRPGVSSLSPRGGRSGSASPAFAYALRGPVGKPGYIGGVGFSDEEGDNNPRTRRASAIAAVETAVRGFTKRQWILLIIIALIDLLSAITISLQAPFYPAEAERKGASPTEYGFVFGIFEFIVFLTSPIFGKYMNKLGPKTVFNVGIALTSISVICFGLLDRINDHTTFITLCFICRIFEALGCGGFFTATFTIIACEFPESVATTFASLETFFGLGLIVGPTVGGALYDVGGFPLPFFVVGGFLLVSAFLSSFVMPKIDKATDDDGKEQVGYGVWTILKIPSVALAAVSIATTSISLGFVSAILEPHIRRFGLTPLQTGLVFIVNGGIYALTAPIWGYICDYMSKPIIISVIGNILIFISFLLIGPASFMPFDTILWVTIVGLVIQGLGFGCCLVAGFIVGFRDSMANGLPDNMATYGVASGLWTSMISLGAWVGPSAAGVLYDLVGFREASWLVLGTSTAVGLATIVYLIFASRSVTEDSETQPLLRAIPSLVGKKDVEAADPRPASLYGSTSGSGNAGVEGDIPA